MLATPKSSLGKRRCSIWHHQTNNNACLLTTTIIDNKPPPPRHYRRQQLPPPTTVTNHHDHQPRQQRRGHATSPAEPARTRRRGTSTMPRQRTHALTHGHNNEARPVTVVNGYHPPPSQAAYNDNSGRQEQRKAMECACDDVATWQRATSSRR